MELARGAERETLNLLEEALHPVGVAVFFCDEELLSSNDRHWDQLVDEAKAAESWLRKHRRRVKEGLEAKLATKRDPGGRPPFGFRRNGGKLMEPDPDKLRTVRLVFELSAAGTTDHEVATEVGLPLFTVRGILTSPLYLGRLRDGGPANWPPVVDPALARQAHDRRAARATNTGRRATPKRPYALTMLHCADCGVRLTGDTGYYRHRDPCPSFVEARPVLPPRPGRTHGKAYRRELYEDVVGEILSEVSLNADLVARVVGEVTPSRQGPDRLTLARIDRDRDTATAKYLRDRDTNALEATMARLDREEREAIEEKVEDGVPADEAVRYLKDLEGTWDAADGGEGRKMLAEALFERIEARGFREVRLHLTNAAIAHGFGTVLPQRLAITVSGRGERARADTPSPSLVIPVTNAPSYVHRDWKTA